jgi:uncharacterized protein involved in exopolysaccharide biosynthesis
MTTETLIHDAGREASQTVDPSAPVAVQEDGDVSLLDFLIALAERKRLIFSSAAIFGLLAIVVSLILPSRYTATVSLLPPQQNSSIG